MYIIWHMLFLLMIRDTNRISLNRKSRMCSSRILFESRVLRIILVLKVLTLDTEGDRSWPSHSQVVITLTRVPARMSAAHVPYDQSAGAQKNDFDFRVDADATIATAVLQDRVTLWHNIITDAINIVDRRFASIAFAGCTHVVIPFNAITLFSFAPAAVQHLAFEIHVVSRFDSTRIECVAQTQLNYRRICNFLRLLSSHYFFVFRPTTAIYYGINCSTRTFWLCAINRWYIVLVVQVYTTHF